ncbi:MAG: hypothetical protein ACPG49_09440 [Chitinophagales bacterium]
MKDAFLIFFTFYSFQLYSQNISYPIESMPDTVYRDLVERVDEQTFMQSPSLATRFRPVFAAFKKVEEQVLVKEEYEGYRPPVYKKKEINVLIKQEHTYFYLSKAATYDRRREQYRYVPPRIAYVKRKNTINSFSKKCFSKNHQKWDTCNWYQITVPAKYKTILWQEEKTPREFIEKTIPAMYKKLQKQIVDWEATKKQNRQEKLIKVSPEYQTIEKYSMIQPAYVDEINGLGDYGHRTTWILKKEACFDEDIFQKRLNFFYKYGVFRAW